MATFNCDLREIGFVLITTLCFIPGIVHTREEIDDPIDYILVIGIPVVSVLISTCIIACCFCCPCCIIYKRRHALRTVANTSATVQQASSTQFAVQVPHGYPQTGLTYVYVQQRPGGAPSGNTGGNVYQVQSERGLPSAPPPYFVAMEQNQYPKQAAYNNQW